ncbi:MAG: hypothetical protein NTX64_02005 [Elusimicrobia bacterium]|nr:hypothetical protein [Elusimicrobiota bacterium]
MSRRSAEGKTCEKAGAQAASISQAVSTFIKNRRSISMGLGWPARLDMSWDPGSHVK